MPGGAVRIIAASVEDGEESEDKFMRGTLPRQGWRSGEDAKAPCHCKGESRARLAKFLTCRAACDARFPPPICGYHTWSWHGLRQ